MANLTQTVAPLSTIIGWFAEDAQPTSVQFETTWKSFFHKSENIPVEQIYQLNDILNLKAERDHLHLDLAKKDGSNLDADDISGLKEVLGVALAAQGIINNISTDVTSEVAVALPDGIYKPKTTGVYTSIGLTAQENYTTLFKKLDGVWSVFSEEKLPMLSAEGKVEEGNTEAVSGGEVYNVINDIMLMSEQYGVLSTTLNSDGIISSASIKWEDGVTGTLTFGDYNSDWLAYDSYTITYQDKIVTQPKVTRDGNGTIIISPLKTIS